MGFFIKVMVFFVFIEKKISFQPFYTNCYGEKTIIGSTAAFWLSVSFWPKFS